MTKSKFSAQDSGTWLPALTQSAPDSCGPLSQCVCVVGCIHPRSTDPETSCSHAHLLSRPPPQVAPGTCAGQQGLDAPTVTESVAEPSQERTSPESEVLHGRLCLRSLGPVPGFWPGGRGGLWQPGVASPSLAPRVARPLSELRRCFFSRTSSP